MSVRACFVTIISLLWISGCTSPPMHSGNPETNYRYVFNHLTAPQPTVIHSHLERHYRSVLGIIPLQSQYNGDWEFELLASRAWIGQVKAGFIEVPFADVSLRRVPEWFSPQPGFSAWRMQSTSYPEAHLFIERNPPTEEQIKVFICRH